MASGQKVKIGLSGGVEPPGCPLPDSTDHFGRQFRTTVLFLQEEKSLFANIDVTFSYFFFVYRAIKGRLIQLKLSSNAKVCAIFRNIFGFSVKSIPTISVCLYP